MAFPRRYDLANHNWRVVEFATELLGETEKAWKVRAKGGGSAWLPKGIVTLERDPEDPKVITVLCPAWMARDKGFV